MTHPINFDKLVASAVAKLPERISPLMRFASSAGGPLPVTLILLSLIAWALITGDRGLLVYAIWVTLFIPLAELIKLVTRRQRPETLYVQNMKLKTYSFPSGHTYVSVLMAGFLSNLSLIYVGGPLAWILIIILLLFSFMVGVSRVYLGAHFPSDVVVGWLLGVLALYAIKIIKSMIII